MRRPGNLIPSIRYICRRADEKLIRRPGCEAGQRKKVYRPEPKRELNTRLSKKVAVVTGASSGVGRSIALALAEEGADLALLGRSSSLLRTVANKCREAGSKAFSYKVDLLKYAEIREVTERVTKRFGSVDI